jgi:hypothetical protein
LGRPEAASCAFDPVISTPEMASDADVTGEQASPSARTSAADPRSAASVTADTKPDLTAASLI